MRKAFVSLDDTRQTIDTVRGAHPWAAEIVEVEGGWIVFESADDAETWKNQE